MNFLLELSEEDFNKQVIIKVNSIIEGFNSYRSKLLTPICTNNLVSSEKDIINFIKSLYNLNNHSLIVDFYLSKLSDKEFGNLYDSLETEDKNFLNDIRNIKPKSNYFLVTDERILDFLVRLCTRELFFITFYFQEYPLTLWGNYDLKFPIFYINEEDIELYNSVIEKNNLKII